MVDYEDVFPELRHVVLEESYVLSVGATGDRLLFVCDLALAPDHPAYQPPEPGEYQCHRRAAVQARSPVDVDYRPSATPGTPDATGERDWGEIDLYPDGDRWVACGEWGTAHLVAPEWTIAIAHT